MGNLIVTEICNKEKDTKPVHVTDSMSDGFDDAIF
jgi:hypothetical protein